MWPDQFLFCCLFKLPSTDVLHSTKNGKKNVFCYFTSVFLDNRSLYLLPLAGGAWRILGTGWYQVALNSMSFAGCWLQTSVDGLKCLYMSREQQITPDPGRKGQLSESFVVFRAMLGGLLRRSHCLWNHLLPYKLQISRVSFPLSSFLSAPWIATSTPQLGKEYIVITFVCLHLNVARKKKKTEIEHFLSVYLWGK